MSEWVRVVFAHDVGADGTCPRCGEDYTECPCPGPTMQGWLYQWRGHELWARQEELDDVMEDVEEQIGKLVYGGMAVDIDLALTEGPDGQPLLHAADCPEVRAMAAAGEQVFTMFGCQSMPDTGIARHTCLGPADPARSAAK